MAASAQSEREETYKQALLKATATIRQLLEENAALRKQESIAVIGMACRFPGGANDPGQFWHLLHEGVDAITDVPPSRWSAEAHYALDSSAPGKMYTVRGGFLDVPVADFDANFFGIAPREARALDPQHRLLLEVSWEALEDACLDPGRLKNSKTGVFMGMSSDDYVQAHRHSGLPERIDAYSMTGSTFSTAVGRVSYTLGLQGPCMALDTACSSSLVAMHLACQSLRSKESELALVGGVNLILSPESHICFSKLQAISPEGKCKTFDASADGYVRGEGCGVVVLKRLTDAIHDGNRILAIVRGSAVNQDGKTNGLAAPNGNAQRAVIRQALDHAGLQPAQIDYVEAHGTGTVLGDPIEVEALGAVFATEREAPLRLGAVKTNIGHLEPAAGIAGFIKVVLSLLHEELPASLHFQRPNRHIAWDTLPLRVVSERSIWRRSTRPRIAGVSSFGFSGTNAHVLIEEAPPAISRAEPDKVTANLLCLSARDDTALRALAADYQTMLSATSPVPAAIADICYSANAGRRHWSHRVAIEGSDTVDIQAKLAAFLQDSGGKGFAQGSCDESSSPRLAFLFSGQGSQYVGMGHGLYQTHAVFKQSIDRCDALLQPLLSTSLTGLLFAAEAETLNQTVFSQPALFALEYALSQLWLAWGIKPHVLMGHSVGEYVAACLAGVFSLEDGIRLIAERGRLMQALPSGGGMASVLAAPDIVATAIRPYAGRVGIAAFNGPRHVVISGKADAIDAVINSLTSNGIRTARLAVSHAFHSHLMRPMLRDFERVARQIAYSPAHTRLISNVTGKAIGSDIASPQYWIDHISQPVAFAAGMQTLQQEGVQAFVELGPQATLLAMGRQCVTDADDAKWLPSLRPNEADARVLHRSLGTLYVMGATIDWASVHAGRDCRWTTVPHYPFQRRRHWIDIPRSGRAVPSMATPGRLDPLLDRMTRSPLLESILFETRFGVAELPLLADHRVFDKVVVSGACLISMILGAAAKTFGEGAIQLSGVALHQALAIPDDDARLVHLAFTPDGKSDMAFRLISLAAGAQPGPEILHVSGIIRMLPHSPAQSPQTLTAFLERWNRLNTEMAGSEVYAAHRRRHITLGPSNQWLRSLRLDANEAMGRLRVPDGSDGVPITVEGYQLHPGLLDSWLSLLVAITGFDGDKPLVPFALNQFNLVRPPRGEFFWAYARRRVLPGFPDRLVGDMWLVDEKGELIAECIGLEGRVTTVELLLRRETRDLSSWFYQQQWIEAPAHQRTRAEQCDAWLVFIDVAGCGAALVERLAEHACRVVTVVAGPGFEQLGPNRYHIDPLRAGDISLLLQAAFPAHSDCFRVAYLWGLDAHAADAAALEAAIAQTCAPVLHLVAAVNRGGYTCAPSLALVTKGAQPAGSSATASELMEVAQAPLWGLCKTIVQEHPELACRCIDLDPGQRDAAALAFLTDELLCTDREGQVAQRGERRRVARLTRYRSPKSDSFPVHADGSYLICGGFGGLGRLMAREMLSRGARDLTLCGRNPTSPEAVEFASELRRNGADIRVCAADLTRVADMRAALATASTDRSIRGIIHAAGVLDDGVLAHLDWQRFCRVLAVKTTGLYHLHELSRSLSLDFFVGFSSMVSLIGSSAQGSYVAANAFVDALMHARRAQGLPGLSINWGPWSDVGMAARLDERQRQRLARQGIVALSPEDAMRALDRLWPDPPAQVGVMHVNWPEFFQQFPGAADLPLFASLRPRPDRAGAVERGMQDGRAIWIEQLRQVAVSRRRGMLTSLVREELCRVLGAGSDEQIEPRRPLFDLGMDSLIAVELRNRLSAALTCPLSTTLLFDYPTLEALVDHLCVVVPGLAFAPPPAESTGAAASKPATNMDALDQLSDAELENLLAEKLRALVE